MPPYSQFLWGFFDGVFSLRVSLITNISQIAITGYRVSLQFSVHEKSRKFQNSFVMSPGQLYHLIRRDTGRLANEAFTSNPIVPSKTAQRIKTYKLGLFFCLIYRLKRLTPDFSSGKNLNSGGNAAGYCCQLALYFCLFCPIICGYCVRCCSI